MKIRFIKAKHWLLITLMGMLGLSACSKDDDEEPRFDMDYGVIETTFNPGN